MFSPPSYTYTDLLEAMQQPCCPVCWLAQRSVHQYIRSLFYEHVNDIKLREGIRASLGYCQEHTWALRDASLGNALGISIIYHDILTNILRVLPASQGGGRSLGMFGRLGKDFSRRVQAFRKAFTPQTACPACEMRDESARLALGAFARSLKVEEIRKPYQASHGLCAVHLNQALAVVDDEDVLDLLLETTRASLSSLDSELAEYIRKNDYRFNKEPWGSEEDAWKRVISRMAGERLS